MSSSYLSRVMNGGRVAVLSGYVRRLLTPPLPGDGLLVVGLLEGLIGWSLSWVFVTSPSLAPFGLVGSIVGLWLVLTAGIVAVGVVFTAPTVRQNRIWLVWATLNISAVAINVLAVAGVFPGPVASVPIVSDLLGFGYWEPWFLALGLGYLATAFYSWTNPQLRRAERVVYALGGVACLAALAPGLINMTALGASIFLVGGLIHVIPMGFDVFADIALILRRTR